MDEIEARFTTHDIRGESGVAQVNEIRDLFKAFAVDMAYRLPNGAERDTVLDHLEAASFLAVAAMARHHGEPRVAPAPEVKPKPKAQPRKKA